MRPAEAQERQEGLPDGHPGQGRTAPVLLVPTRQQRPLAVRRPREQMRIRVDAHGVVPALREFAQDPVPVLVARSGPAALQPGEVPHRDRQRPAEVRPAGKRHGTPSSPRHALWGGRVAAGLRRTRRLGRGLSRKRRSRTRAGRGGRNRSGRPIRSSAVRGAWPDHLRKRRRTGGGASAPGRASAAPCTRTHDILALLLAVSALDRPLGTRLVLSPGNLGAALTPFAVKPRYPGDTAATEQPAKDALKTAQRIVATVRSVAAPSAG